MLGALPARHPAVPAAAERGGGGVGGPGAGALRRVVQPRPVPIHLPRSSGDGQKAAAQRVTREELRDPARLASGFRRPGTRAGGAQPLLLGPPPPPTRPKTPATADLAGTHQSRAARSLTRPGSAPSGHEEIRLAVRSAPLTTQPCCGFGRVGSGPGRGRVGGADSLPAVTCLVCLELGGRGPTNPEGG